MKLELERSEFLKAWQTAEKYTSSKTTMLSLTGVRIAADLEAGTVTLEATDLKSSVRCTAKGAAVIEPGVVVLNASLFGNMLRKATADSITLELSDDRGILKAGKSRSRFTVIPAETFPNIPESSGAEVICTVMAKDLGQLISEGNCAASQPSDFPKYLGTCLLKTAQEANEMKYLVAVSTDGKRLARSKVICPDISKFDELLIPAAALKELGKTFNSEDRVTILADGSTVWFKLDDAEFSLRRIDAAFPKYEKILNEEVKVSAKIERSTLVSALERIDIIAKNNPAHIMAMSLSPDTGELRISARAPELGTVSETLDAEISGSAIQIGFNVSYFQDGVKAVNADKVLIEFSDEEGQTRLFKDESSDFLYMLMPIRLTPQDIVNDESPEDFSSHAPEQPQDYGESEPEYQEPEEAGEGNYDSEEPF